MKSNKSFFILGTDTDIGKTYISSLLFKGLKKYNFDYYKPIQSGCIKKNGELIALDPESVCNFSGISYEKNMCSYLLEEAVSPHLASEIESIEIDPSFIKETFFNKLALSDSLIVEGAGGIFVPLIRDRFYIYDLVKFLDLPVILVCSAKVGAINHTMLSIKFLESQGISILGLVFNKYSGEFFEKDNIKVVSSASGIKNILTISKDQDYIDDEILKKFLRGEINHE